MLAATKHATKHDYFTAILVYEQPYGQQQTTKTTVGDAEKSSVADESYDSNYGTLKTARLESSVGE